ncbi:MFS family permease [Catenulispora sp. EB89]|uniref:MFS transporter n=1 Tax=Catenulispora sp. EB89 TaxID=3156257 RepID=UPI003515323F
MRLRLALLVSTQFVVALDYNIVYVALPDIGTGLGFGAQSLQWVVSSYAVAFGGLLMLGGRLVDRIGRRDMFVVGLALFAAACLAGGLATGPATLLAARAVQGVGAAMLTPATLSLVTTGFAEGPERTRALSLWSAAGSAGLAAGALLGGVLTQVGGWRWVMLVMVPPALVIMVAAPRLLARDRVDRRTLTGFDLPGALVATVGSMLLVFGLASGPQAGWGSVRGAGSIGVGVALLGAFAVIETGARDPLVPPRLLRTRSLAVAMAAILIFQSALGGAYYAFTTYLQVGHGYSALATGLAFLPVTVLSVVAGMRFGPALIGRWGARTSLFVSMLINGAGIVLLAAGMAPDASFWTLVPGIAVWGVGGGMTFTAMFVTATSGVRAGEQGVASAMATTAQQLGGAAGLAVLVAIATAGLHSVGGHVPPTEVINGLRQAGFAAGGTAMLGAFLAFALKEQRRSQNEPDDRGPDPDVLRGVERAGRAAA